MPLWKAGVHTVSSYPGPGRTGYGVRGYGVSGFGFGGNLPFSNPSIGYYLSLLTHQYQNSPNLIAWLSACLQPFIDVGVLAGQMVNAFDLNAAIGPQLDVIGQIVGANRTVGFQPSGGVNPRLNDPTYRILLAAKIAQNQWNGQIDSLYTLWPTLFPGGTITFIDNQDMTATIILSGSFTSIDQDLIVNGYIIPRPEGVLYNYTFSMLPILGFDQNNTFVAGFDLGHFA